MFNTAWVLPQQLTSLLMRRALSSCQMAPPGTLPHLSLSHTHNPTHTHTPSSHPGLHLVSTLHTPALSSAALYLSLLPSVTAVYPCGSTADVTHQLVNSRGNKERYIYRQRYCTYCLLLCVNECGTWLVQGPLCVYVCMSTQQPTRPAY